MPFPARRHRAARGLAVGARRTGACGSSCRSAARSAACSTSRRATPQVAYQARFNENVAAHYDALETLRAVLGAAGGAAPHRVLRHLDDPGQRDRGVDGRLRRRPDEAGGVSEVPDPGLGARRLGARAGQTRARGSRGRVDSRRRAAERRAPEPPSPRAREPRAPSRAILDDFASMHEVVLRRYRKLLENGGPFPDLILIDGGKGQLSAAYEALEELGLGQPGGGRHREEGRAALHARSRRRRSRCRDDSPALLLIQRIRDEAHRFAVTFHRQSRTKRDLRSELDDDRRDRAAPAQGAADGLRQLAACAAPPARSWCGWSAPRPPTRCWRTSPGAAAVTP